MQTLSNSHAHYIEVYLRVYMNANELTPSSYLK